MSGTSSESGFGVVEALVALALIAAMTGLLFEALAMQARAAEAIAAKRRAILLAQSLLAEATVAGTGDDVPEAGESQGLRWRTRRRVVDGGGLDGGVPLDAVRIEVGEGARRLVTVQTLRLER